MIALIGTLDLSELLVVAGGALLVFGKRLPEVAVRAAAQVVRLRRSVTRMWREAGLEEELRRVRRDIEFETPKLPSVAKLASESKWRAQVQSDIEDLDFPDSPTGGSREDHPEDHDDREVTAEPETEDIPEEGEQRQDFHAVPDPEPSSPPGPEGPVETPSETKDLP